MSLRIGVDIDGVLADFRTAFHVAAQKCVNRHVREVGDPKSSEQLDDRDVRRVWDYISRTTNWWMDLQPYEADQVARLYDRHLAGRGSFEEMLWRIGDFQKHDRRRGNVHDRA